MSDSIQRRDALKKLGALAISAPALASMACNEDEATDAGMNMGPVTGGPDGGIPGGSPDGGGQGGIDSSTNPTGGGTGGGSPGGASDGAVGSTDAAADAAVPSGGGDASVGGPGGFLPPDFEDAPTCALTAVDDAGEGPFFIHETEVMNDPSILRVDMREGKPGVEMQLNLRLLDEVGSCMSPIKDVEVYVWHTDAKGYYSGWKDQNPDARFARAPPAPDNTERFCRGVQVTDANGVVSFRTIYPGWYYGRPIHIHFVALRKGSGPATTSYQSPQYHIFTTQMYFEETFSKNIQENNAPYNTRITKNGYQTYVKPNPDSGVRPSTRLEGNIVVASLNIITSATGSRT